MPDIDKFDDFYDGEDIPEVPAPEETPDQIEERELAADTTVVKKHRFRNCMIVVVVLLLLTIGVTMWIRYWRPAVWEAQQTGRIMEVKKEGVFFKTYEGNMISEEYVNNENAVYQRDFMFSVDNDSVAKALMDLQGKGKKITVQYQEYSGVQPWRGSSKRNVVGVKVAG